MDPLSASVSARDAAPPAGQPPEVNPPPENPTAAPAATGQPAENPPAAAAVVQPQPPPQVEAPPKTEEQLDKVEVRPIPPPPVDDMGAWLRPMPYDQNPFKELAPGYGAPRLQVSDLKVPTSCNVLELARSGAAPLPAVSGGVFSLPGAELGVPVDSLLIAGGVIGGPGGVPVEPPLVASPHPPGTTSYEHLVLSRMERGNLDLRMQLMATRHGDVEEVHHVGRVWTPHAEGTVTFRNGGGNWDAAAIHLAPAWSALPDLKLMTPKDAAFLGAAMKWVDPVEAPVARSIHRSIMDLAKQKVRLSRLYWRLWYLYFEASAAEERQEEFVVTEVHHAHIPGCCSSARLFEEAVRRRRAGVQPFFVTSYMLEALQGVPVVQVLFAALASRIRVVGVFGAQKHWPDLGGVVMVLPQDPASLGLTDRVTLTSGDVFQILRFYGDHLGQRQLVLEIGRTVASFLYRPRGDAVWGGASRVSIALPPFSCAQTLFLEWAEGALPVDQCPFGPVPYYKAVWVGMVQYMMCSLSLSVAFSHYQYQTRRQLRDLGFAPHGTWLQLLIMASGCTRGEHSSPLIRRAQAVAAGLGWGRPYNRMTASLTMLDTWCELRYENVPQWSEWLLFQPLIHEMSPLCSALGHLHPITTIPTRTLQRPSAVQGRLGVGDVFYRFAQYGGGVVELHTGGHNQARQRKIVTTIPRAYNGAPLDGLFQDVWLQPGRPAMWFFGLRDAGDHLAVNHQWRRRQELAWELVGVPTEGPSAGLGAPELEELPAQPTDVYLEGWESVVGGGDRGYVPRKAMRPALPTRPEPGERGKSPLDSVGGGVSAPDHGWPARGGRVLGPPQVMTGPGGRLLQILKRWEEEDPNKARPDVGWSCHPTFKLLGSVARGMDEVIGGTSTAHQLLGDAICRLRELDVVAILVAMEEPQRAVWTAHMCEVTEALASWATATGQHGRHFGLVRQAFQNLDTWISAAPAMTPAEWAAHGSEGVDPHELWGRVMMMDSAEAALDFVLTMLIPSEPTVPVSPPRGPRPPPPPPPTGGAAGGAAGPSSAPPGGEAGGGDTGGGSPGAGGGGSGGNSPPPSGEGGGAQQQAASLLAAAEGERVSDFPQAPSSCTTPCSPTSIQGEESMGMTPDGHGTTAEEVQGATVEAPSPRPVAGASPPREGSPEARALPAARPAEASHIPKAEGSAGAPPPTGAGAAGGSGKKKKNQEASAQPSTRSCGCRRRSLPDVQRASAVSPPVTRSRSRQTSPVDDGWTIEGGEKMPKTLSPPRGGAMFGTAKESKRGGRR